MVDLTEKIQFIATLVYEKFTGWCVLEAHVFTAQHPEGAYELAQKKGKEDRRDRRFAGLAELRVNIDDRPLFGKLQKVPARDLVVEKEKLAAFQDPRWAETPD
jgi:hypothetical protein